MKYKLTKEQQNILTTLETEPIVAVDAKAGCGKTATSLLTVDHFKPRKGFYTAYNKSIVVEAQEKFPSNMECKTKHAFALSWIKPKNRIEDFTYLCIKEKLSYPSKKQIIDVMDSFFLSNSTDMEDFISILEDPALEKLAIKYINKMLEDEIPPTFNFLLKYLHLLLDQKIIKIEYDLMILDECLPKYMMVATSTGDRSIKAIYNSLIRNEEVLVKSLNHQNGNFEYKRALNPLKSKDRETLRISTKGLNKLDCTPNHKILTQRGYVQAADLLVGKDYIILDSSINQKIKNIFTKDQSQVIPDSYLESDNIVTCIETIGKHTVYDFEVEDNHNFLTSKSKNATKTVVHNCQDTTAVFYEIFKLIKADRKLIVGDPFQNIYGFMNTVNAFNLLEDIPVLPLTKTFRCSTKIAKRVENFGKKHLNKDFKYKGTDTEIIDDTVAFIGRTNGSILMRLQELQEEGKSFSLTRPVKEIFALPMALANVTAGREVFHKKYKYLEGEFKRYTMSGMKGFYSYLLKYVEDEELHSCIKFMNKIREKNINIFQLKKDAESMTANPKIWVVTAHSFKGREVGTVIIEDSLNKSVNKIIEKGGPESIQDQEELNLGYVACTRAKHTLLNCRFL